MRVRLHYVVSGLFAVEVTLRSIRVICGRGYITVSGLLAAGATLRSAVLGWVVEQLLMKWSFERRSWLMGDKKMKIACISASNNKLAEEKSISIRVCSIIKDIILKETKENAEVDIIALKDYDIKPCILCGACYSNGLCIYDEEFNKIIKVLETVQGMFLVVPHYSPIPSKLLILFEKVNEITYAGWINNPSYQSPFCNMRVGIIGHGGMVENEANIRYYHDNLVTPVANTLKALSFNIVQPNDDYANGVSFGLKDDSCLRKSENSIFPDIIQDWEMIEERIKPLIIKGIKEMNIG